MSPGQAVQTKKRLEPFGAGNQEQLGQYTGRGEQPGQAPESQERAGGVAEQVPHRRVHAVKEPEPDNRGNSGGEHDQKNFLHRSQNIRVPVSRGTRTASGELLYLGELRAGLRADRADLKVKIGRSIAAGLADYELPLRLPLPEAGKSL